MEEELKRISELIDSLALEKEDEATFFEQCDAVKKKYHRMHFMLNRTLNDKSIAINLLNQSIEDLQTQTAYIEKTNEQLLIQKKEIEAKNRELELQKQLVEEQSKKLQRNLKALELAFEELERFAYIASHDLKNPLRTISSFAQLIDKRYKKDLDADAQDFLGFIVENAAKMDGIIQDLLEYSRAGGRPKEMVETDLNNLIEIVKFNTLSLLKENNVEIKYEGLPRLKVVKKSIVQLFQYLVTNAIKFRKELDPIIEINCAQEEGFWHFKVADNGQGMDESLQEKAFQPFLPVDGDHRNNTGTGLAICKKIVRMHNGKIWYESEPGEGTTFHFTLPAG